MRVEEKFPCLYCHDNHNIFENAEDYKNHLRHIHKVVKKLDEGVLAAKKKAGIPVICNFVEEITIDDDSEEEENISITDSHSNEVTHNSDAVPDIQVSQHEKEDLSTRNIFELNRNDAEEFAKVSSANLFRQSRHILMAKKGDYHINKDEGQDDLATDLDIEMFFEKLKNKVSNIDINGIDTYSKSEVPERERDRGNKSIAEFKSSVAQALASKASNIEAEVSSHRRPRQTVFLCPLADCPDNFSTSRAGMESGEAARHLNTRHGVTPDMVTPGRYKFRKMKVARE